MYEFGFFSESDVRCNVHTLVFSTVHRIFYEVLENKRMFFGENVGQVFGFFLVSRGFSSTDAVFAQFV